MSELLDRTLQEDIALARQCILAREPRLDAVRTGTLVNTLATALALLLRDAKRHALREVAKLYFQTAAGEDLDALAIDRRQLARKTASAAVGRLSLTRSSIGAVTIPAGAVFTDPTGIRYLASAETIWTGPAASVSIAAEAAGQAGNRATGILWSAGGATWSQGVTDLIISNQEPITGGNPAESDTEFLARIMLWWQVQQRATIEALRYASLLVPSVRRASVDESHITADQGGYVDLYISDGSDGYNATLGNLVKREIEAWRAAGVVVNVWGATVVNQAIQVSFVQEAGGRPDAVAKGVAGILAYVNNLAIGSTLRRPQISRAGLAADPSLIDCAVILPAADIVPHPGQVIRCPVAQIEVV